MRKFKKAIAFALASAMIVSVVPVSAATTNTAKATKTTIYTYAVNNGANANAKRTWIKTTAKKGYTVKIVNKTTSIVKSISKTGFEAKKAGTAKINVNYYNSKGKYVGTKTVKVTVKAAPMIGKVSLDKDTINVGETATVSNAGKGTAYFYSSNKDVATVDKKTGKITAVGGGTTTITAVNTVTKGKLKVTLTVVADAPVAKQTGAKTLTVTNGVSMKDKKVTVKRNGTDVTLADTNGVVFTEDGKGITITTAAKLVAAEYTIVIGDKEVKVNADAEKVASIKILSDKAAAAKDKPEDSVYNKARVGYKVENQFGEDITKQTSLNANASVKVTLKPASHVIEFEAPTSSGFIINRDIISVSLINTEAALSTQATLTVSDEAAVDTITYAGLYNSENKTLTEDTDLDTDAFYMLFEMKDQYGNGFDKLTEGTQVYLSLAGGFTNLTIDQKKDFKQITKDGKTYWAYPLKKNTTGSLTQGTATLTVISARAGKSITENIQVNVGGRAESITVSAPSTIVAGEETELDYNAVDASGNPVTSYKKLKDVIITGGVTGKIELKWKEDAKTGKAKLVLDATGANVEGSGRYEFATFTLQSGSTLKPVITNVQLQVKEIARPTAIVGLKDVDTKLAAVTGTSGSAVTLKVKNFKIEDQYGRIMSDSTVKKALTRTNEYKLQAITGKERAESEALQFTASGATLSSLDSVVGTVSVKAAGKIDTLSVEFTISNGKASDNTLTGSTYTQDFTTVKLDDIDAVTVETDKVYVPAANKDTGAYDEARAKNWAVDVTVKAKGAKLPGTQYTVTSDDFTVIPGTTSDSWKICAPKAQSAYKAFDTATETKGTITITLANGNSVKQEVTLSKVAPTVAKATVTTDNITVTGSAIGIKEIMDKAGVDTLKDNYGKDVTYSAGKFTLVDTNEVKPTVTFKSVDGTSINAAVKNNGTNAATVDLTQVKSVKAVITFATGVEVVVGISNN